MITIIPSLSGRTPPWSLLVLVVSMPCDQEIQSKSGVEGAVPPSVVDPLHPRWIHGTTGWMVYHTFFKGKTQNKMEINGSKLI